MYHQKYLSTEATCNTLHVFDIHCTVNQVDKKVQIFTECWKFYCNTIHKGKSWWEILAHLFVKP